MNPVDTLTKRERELFDIACTGVTQEEMAEQLFVDVRTVKWHLTNVYRKLGLTGTRKYYKLIAKFGGSGAN